MEKLMQAVWRHKLFDQTGLHTVDGRSVKIINQGTLNTAAGPDFFNASIKIGDETWVGNVEIHVNASDWFRHGHDTDDAYDSVILHVVDKSDATIHRKDGQEIPQMELPCTPDLAARVHAMSAAAASGLPCAEMLKHLPRVFLTDWLSAVGMQRIYAKSDRVLALLDSFHGDWEETAYVTLARALGMGINADPFERLARSLPLQFIRKHADDRFAIESLFFGQAGLLPEEDGGDPYVKYLIDEYQFLAIKFSLRRPMGMEWKFSGVRPVSFPARRIVSLVDFILEGSSIMSRFLDVKNIEQARQLFAKELSGFWLTHYTFNKLSADTTDRAKGVSPDVLIINALVPVLHAYGISRSDYALAEFAVDLLSQIPAENNSLVRAFKVNGVAPRDAFDSQAMIELRRNYCMQHKCIYCRIGHRCLASMALRTNSF